MNYRGLELDAFQAEAIAALEAGSSVLVAAPTGTGKTVIADWAVERALAAGQEVVYTAPIKALSNQKFRDYCALLGEERVGLVTGDLVIRRDAPCRVMTTEILRNMLLSGEEMENLAVVIIDEIHFLDDRERGTTWEEVLIYLPQRVAVVGLSATLSNLEEFAAWLESVRQRKVAVVEERRRAVPLVYRVAAEETGLVSLDEMRRQYAHFAKKHGYGRERTERGARRRRERGTSHVQVFHMLHPDQLPYLYFVFSRKQTEELARDLGGYVGGRRRSLLDFEEREELEARLEQFWRQPGAQTALSDRLANLYRLGIAYHHAGLHVMLKLLVEQLYESRLIKVLYCTSTFALGINMPARTAVFEDLKRYDGKELIPLPTREFMQMAGRAGRRGMDEAGMVVIRANLEGFGELSPRIQDYLSGRYEPVQSRFSLSFNSVVNLLHRHTPERIREIVEKSFLSFHREQKANALQARAEAIQAEIDGGELDPEKRREARKLQKLHRRSSAGRDRTWEEFQEKVTFLTHWGYLDETGGFNAGANVLMHVQIQELFTTELVLEGVFEGMDPATLFGVLCGMVAELPRGVMVPASRQFKGLGRQIERIRFSEIVTAGEEMMGTPVVWDPQLIPVGRWWAEGRSLGEILLNVHSPTDISGSLVGAFRRAKDLAGQLRSVWTAEPERQEMLRGLIKGVSRGEVEVVD